MTSADDIRYAMFLYDDHVARHKCRIGQCEERRSLWLAAMRVAEQWGRDSAADTRYL